MIELAAVIGIIAGWVFRMAYSPASKSLYENLYRERIKTIRKLQEENKDLAIRLEVQKAFAKGLNGLPMPVKIDRETVFQMLKTGFSRRTIANRLGCSEKSIQRIAKQIEKAKNRKFKKDNNLSDPQVEKAVRDYYLKMEPAEQTAKRFGVSKQALIK